MKWKSMMMIQTQIVCIEINITYHILVINIYLYIYIYCLCGSVGQIVIHTSNICGFEPGPDLKISLKIIFRMILYNYV